MEEHILAKCVCVLLAITCGSAADVPKYTVSVILNEPFTMIATGDPKPTEKFVGYIPDLIARLSQMLNFEYELKHVKDGKYGSIGANGNWTGLIGEVLAKETDVAAADMTITSAREAHVDFIAAFMHTGLTAVTRRPTADQVSPGQHFTFLRPFSAEVFIVIAAAYVLVSLFLWAMNVYNPYEWAGRANRLIASPKQVDYFTARGSFWYTFTIMQWQGFDRSPRSLASRTLSCFWMAFVALTLTFYTASLFSMLAVSQSSSLAPAQTIEDIIASPNMDYGCLRGGSTMAYFRKGVGPMYDQFRSYANSHPESFVSSTPEGLDRVRKSNGRYAYICEATAALVAVSKDCTLQMVDTTIKMRSYGLVVRENWPMRDAFHTAMLQLHENNELAALERKWFYDRGQCWDKARDILGRSRKNTANYSMLTSIFGGSGVTLRMFSGPLIFLLIGFILAALVTVAEIVFYKYKGQHIQTDSRALQEDSSPI